jgi:hypothetical protein
MRKGYFYVMLLVVAILIAGCENGLTANVVCPQYECVNTLAPASIEMKVTDDHGTGCLLDCSANVKVKNLENQPSQVRVMADCHTMDKKFSARSEQTWMQPGEEKKLNLPIQASISEDWQCENFRVESGQVQSCLLREK